MTAIRAAFALCAACMLTAIDANPSAAETYRPWCAQYSSRGGGGATNCGFTSYQQCMMTAGPGTGATCVQNPWYLWYGSNSPRTTGRGGRARRY
jgi:hypothetical protein